MILDLLEKNDSWFTYFTMRDILKFNLDDPTVTISRREVVRKKGFIHKIYEDWYNLIKSHLPSNNGIVVELGSGAGFIKETIPETITSDVMYLPFIDVVMDGLNLPFPASSIDCLVLIDVFHHISNVNLFFNDAINILHKSGRIIMIEPWINRWSHWIFSNLHHEVIDISMDEWGFDTSGPLSGANQALPWIVFKRDRVKFEETYPALKIKKIRPLMPFVYLLSGGIKNNLAMPAFSYSFWKKVEQGLFNNEKKGMFGLVVLEKVI